MKLFINVTIGMILIIVCCTGCSKEREKTPAQVNNDVVALLQQNEIDKALELAESALMQAKKKYGAENQSTAEYLQTLAMVYSAKKDIERAELNYKKALSIIIKTDGNDSINAAKALNNLASLFFASKNYAQAISYYKQSLAIAEKKFSPGDPRIEAIQNNIKTCQELSSGQMPLQTAENRNSLSHVQDLVPTQIKEAALSDLSRQNIIISGMVPQPFIKINDKGVIFPYIALKSDREDNGDSLEEKVVVLFAAKKDETEQNKFIFQQCRIISFQNYMNKLDEGGIELLKKELMKIFPGVYY